MNLTADKKEKKFSEIYGRKKTTGSRRMMFTMD